MNAARSKLLRDVFDEAAERAPEERNVFLDQACGGDTALKQEVHELLNALEDASTQSIQPHVPFKLASSDDAQALVGSRIGGFHLRRLIGVGGMGAVYEAIQDRPRRTVALKLMNQRIASDSALRRFEFEAQTLARLHHPGIAQIFQVGTHDENGRSLPFFAMEYIPNALTITEYSAQRRLDVRARLELLAKVCDAVHHGHQKGIIHRDLKPGNILVDSNGQPKVIDFGIARATDSDLTLTILQTAVGSMAGTIQYMSPEQCNADPHDLDTRSDVYALGLVMYELLCERRPYEVPNVLEAARIIRDVAPLKPSSINRVLRGDVETIVLKALEKDRARRYQSAAELCGDIQRYLGHEPIAARPPSVVYQWRMFAKRNRALVRSAMALFTTLIVAIIVISVLLAQVQRARTRQAELTDRVIQALTQQLSQSVQIVDHSGQKRIAREVIRSAANHFEKQFGNVPEVYWQLLQNVAGAYASIGDLERAEPYAHQAIALAQETFGPVGAQTLDAKSRLAEIYRNAPDYERAEQLYLEILNLDRTNPKQIRNESRLYNYADMLRDIGRCADAEALLREAIDLLRHKDLNTRWYEMHLAGVIGDQGRFNEAVTLYRNYIAEQSPQSPGGQETLMAYREYARLCLQAGQMNEAEQLQVQAMQRYERDPSLATHALEQCLVRELQGLIAMEHGRLDEALETFQEVAQLADNSLKIEYEWFAAHFRVDEGRCLGKLNRFHEAEKVLLDAYAVLTRRLGDRHHRTQNAMRALLELYEKAGDPRAEQWRSKKLRASKCES